jgi:hypothetical protein
MWVRCIIRQTTRLHGIGQGIDANLKKVNAIEQLQSPWTQKENEKLADMMAALS